MPPNIEELQTAIRETHGCDSKWLQSVKVTETFQDKIAWDGTVEVFEVIGHPKATRVYAWTYKAEDENKTMAILGMSPIDSPRRAVQVAIAAKARES
jgi:hypothetical protein